MATPAIERWVSAIRLGDLMHRVNGQSCRVNFALKARLRSAEQRKVRKTLGRDWDAQMRIAHPSHEPANRWSEHISSQR